MTITPRAEVLAPASPLDLVLRQRALQLAAAFENAGLRRLALHLDDAEDLACALLGAWRRRSMPGSTTSTAGPRPNP